MATVVIELEGELGLGEPEGRYQSVEITVDEAALDVVIRHRSHLPVSFVGPVGPCKLRLEIERP